MKMLSNFTDNIKEEDSFFDYSPEKRLEDLKKQAIYQEKQKVIRLEAKEKEQKRQALIYRMVCPVCSTTLMKVSRPMIGLNLLDGRDDRIERRFCPNDLKHCDETRELHDTGYC